MYRDYKYGGPVITERFDIDVKQDVKKEKKGLGSEVVLGSSFGIDKARL